MSESLGLQRGVSERPELVAPAGSLEAGFAAFQYGADAVYAGLKKFSARADAENLTLEDFSKLIGYARGLSPPRRVYAAVNTLILQRELGEFIESLGTLWEIGVDAAIVQDLGVARLIKKNFKDLALHASTQMAVHNRYGVETLSRLGFRRVILARELTLEEIRDCASVQEIEVECFVHGALCYSYSGLCLFSSHALGRSGNRGQCAQVCRSAFIAKERLPGRSSLEGLPFSMKDLALTDRLTELASSGVKAFKIEGRKRTPLYVAAVTDLYRKLLDGKLQPGERRALEEDVKTIFSRPWTRAYLDSREEIGVTDPRTSGHRGAPTGTVEAVVCRFGTGGAYLRMRTSRRLERFDGLQVELPGMYKPFGFSVEKMRLIPDSRRARPRNVYEAPAGSLVEIELPKEYPPIPPGTVVYCSSSQEVKRRYRIRTPASNELIATKSLDVKAKLSAEDLTVSAEATTRLGGLQISRSLPGPFAKAKDPSRMEEAFRNTFSRLGGTGFKANRLEFENPEGLFVPASHLNSLRRELVSALESKLADSLREYLDTVKRQTLPGEVPPTAAPSLKWSLKVDSAAWPSDFTPEDWHNLDELVVGIWRDPLEELEHGLAALAEKIDTKRIRLALPPIMRFWEERELASKVAQLVRRGWTNWEVANLSAWSFLPTIGKHLDISADWPLYVTNRQAALQLLEMGVSRFVLSPEDGLENMRTLLTEFGQKAVVIVRQDTPLFISETCPIGSAGGCSDRKGCLLKGARLVSGYGQRIELVQHNCRVTALDVRAFSLAGRLEELAATGASTVRAEFGWRDYTPARVREIWRALRTGRPVEEHYEGNYSRGIL